MLNIINILSLGTGPFFRKAARSSKSNGFGYKVVELFCQKLGSNLAKVPLSLLNCEIQKVFLDSSVASRKSLKNLNLIEISLSFDE